MFNEIKIILANTKEKKRRRWQKSTKCCNTCKYKIEAENFYGYVSYKCLLKDPDFISISCNLASYYCKHYKPCKGFKKYLEGKYNAKK